MLSTKKMHRVRVKFYLGQNENCSLGDCSTSDSSEELFQRGSGGRSTCKLLVKGEFSAIKRLTKDFLFFFFWNQTILLRGFGGRLKSWEDNDIRRPSPSHLPSSSGAERSKGFLLVKRSWCYHEGI